MFCYKYDPVTKEYKGKTEAYLDPLETEAKGENVYLLPANATFVKCSEDVAVNSVYVWNGTEWEMKPDYRGKTYYKKDTKEMVVINEIGIEPDDTMTNLVPIDSECVWNSSKNKWVIPFDVLKRRKYEEIAAKRFQFESGGVQYDGHTYKTDRESASLLKGAYDKAKNDSSYIVNWKTVDGFVTLTADKVIEIYDRVSGHIQSAFDAEMVIDKQIAEAKTEKQLDDIVWVDPN